MKLIDKIAQRDPRKLFYMLEFFPPKTDEVKAPCTLAIRESIDVVGAHLEFASRALKTYSLAYRAWSPWILLRSASHGVLGVQRGIAVLTLPE